MPISVPCGFGQSIEHVFVYNGCYSDFRRRRHGRPPRGLLGHSFLGYLQNHDQIGNRAKGERIGHLISLGRLKIAAALVLTAPFIPMLFQGEEWGASSPFLYFTDHEDSDLGRLVTEGRRREFAAFGAHAKDVPDPQEQVTLAVPSSNWDESNSSPHAESAGLVPPTDSLAPSSSFTVRRSVGAGQTDCDEGAKWFVMSEGICSRSV